MSSKDISRHLFRPAKRYVGARMQQGRALLDSDWNEGAAYNDERQRRTTLDWVGSAGSPDDGFSVSDNPVVLDGEFIDYPIAAGSIYLGGLRFEIGAGQTVRSQLDDLQRVSSPGDTYGETDPDQVDFVYMCGWEQSVSAVEDRELLDIALGGVDTTVRVRHMKRVHVLRDIAESTCEAAWEAFRLAPNGFPNATIDDEGRVRSPARISVSFTSDEEPDEACGNCEPKPAEGYRLGEPQAIRVMLVGEGDSWVWGFDDGAPLYRVQVDGNRIRMLTPARDDFHRPAAGMAVEILGWSALLENDEVVAQEVGTFARVLGADPSDPDCFEVEGDVLTGIRTEFPELGKSSLGDDGFLYMRVWNRGADRDSQPTLPVSIDGSNEHVLGFTGLKVDFYFGDAEAGCNGDYWVIAARPQQPEKVTPWNLFEVAEPHGPRRWCAPLGLAQWGPRRLTRNRVADVTVESCRPTFAALSASGACCTLRVDIGGAFSSVQAALDALPLAGGRICVGPGRFVGEVSLIGRRDVDIVGCGGQTVLVSDQAGILAPALVTIEASFGIRLRNLRIEAAGQHGIYAHNAIATNDDPSELEISSVSAFTTSTPTVETMAGIVVTAGFGDRIFDSRVIQDATELSVHPAIYGRGTRLRLERCSTTALAVFEEAEADVLTWGGIQLAGDSQDVRVLGCKVVGGFGHGITLGSVAYASLDVTVPVDGYYPAGVSSIVTVGDPVVVLAVKAELPGPPTMPMVNTGPLVGVRIEDCEVTQTMSSGIAVVGFVANSASGSGAAPVVVDGFRCLRNWIHHCGQRTAAVGDQLAANVAQGGLVLDVAKDVLVRGNLVRNNGVTVFTPIAAAFVGFGRTLEFDANKLVDNGSNLNDTVDPFVAGNRGGILVRRARALNPGALDAETLPPHAPALRISRNVIQVPEGKAVQAVVDSAGVQINSNQFHGRGDNAPEDYSSPISVSVNAIAATGRGALVDLRLDGTGGDFPVPPGPPGPPVPLIARVQFHDNQAELDWPDKLSTGPALAAVVIQAREGTASLQRNQLFTRMESSATPIDFLDFVKTPGTSTASVANLICEAWSVSCADNRLTEGLYEAGISAMTYSGFSNFGVLNTSTHCFLVLGDSSAVPAAQLQSNNHELVEVTQTINGEPFCTGSRRIDPPIFGPDGASTYVVIYDPAAAPA